MRVIGVIPSRYASVRLPAKPLVEIAGKPLVQWVWEAASRARSLNELLVATDDERIARVVEAFGGKAVMTPPECPSGTDRIACAVKDRAADVVVINKVDTASLEAVTTVRDNVATANPGAIVIEAASPIFVEQPDAMRGKRVLVVGDTVVERYYHCDAAGIASESPMMRLRAMGRDDYDGGAAIVASHLAGLGARPVLVTSLAPDEDSDRIEERLETRGIEIRTPRQRRRLAIHSRYLADESKVFRVDEASAFPLDSQEQEQLASLIRSAARRAGR